MSKEDSGTIEPGTVCVYRVGWPGNDHDLCVVTGTNELGDYRILFQVYGAGDVFERATPKSHPIWWIRPLTTEDRQRMAAEYVAAADILAAQVNKEQ